MGGRELCRVIQVGWSILSETRVVEGLLCLETLSSCGFFSCLGYLEFTNHVLSRLDLKPCRGRLPTLLAVCWGTFPALFEEKGHFGGSVAFLR